MGLFRGFKAKFTRNSSEKQKSQEVVCLRYHIFSEFDKQDNLNQAQSTINPDVKKNQVIRRPSGSKSRPSIIQNTQSSIFENSKETPISKAKSLPNINNDTIDVPVTSYSNKKKAPKNPLAQQKSNHQDAYETLAKHSRSNDDITLTTSVVVPIKPNATSLTAVSTQLNREIKDTDGGKTEEVTIKTNSISINEKSAKQTKSILKAKTAYEETGEHVFDSRYQDQSTMISSFSTFKTIEHLKTYSDNDTASIQTNEEDFKVNVMQYDNNFYYSEDDMSPVVADNDTATISTGYSSQAASIFFGGDDVPEIVRPRNVKIQAIEDDVTSDSADC